MPQRPDTPGGASLESFSAATRAWFTGVFAEPTQAQAQAWTAIGKGDDTLVIAPTGSGKTLAAFLWALDRLAATPPPADPKRRCRILYISPLKALATDIERNLRAPLTGIRHAARNLGLAEPDIHVAVRTGDTAADERRKLASKPPDVLITTPESLFLLLTSKARDTLRGVETVIVDEVHALAGNKRGAHLAVSLERLDALRTAGSGPDAVRGPAQRIGLSATVRPVAEVAGFLGGARQVTVVQPPSEKRLELNVVVPVEDMTEIGGPPVSARRDPGAPRPPGAPGRHRPGRWGTTRSGSGRSGRTSRNGCSTSSRSTAPRSCSPTPGGWPSGCARGSTSSPPSARRRPRKQAIERNGFGVPDGMRPARAGSVRGEFGARGSACRTGAAGGWPRRRSWRRRGARRAHPRRSRGPTTGRSRGRNGRRSRRR